MRRLLCPGAIVLVLGVAAAVPRAQDAPPRVFRSGTSLVNLTATVTDREGRPIRGLRKEDFSVFDEGVPQELAFFATGEKVPVSLGLLVDTSGSMIDKLDDVEDALRHLLEMLGPDDQVFLMEFAVGADMIASFAGGRDRVRGALGRLEAHGGTALYDGVVDAIREVTRGAHQKRAVIVVTDGNDTNSLRSAREARDEVTRSESLVYALGIGHRAQRSFWRSFWQHGTPENDSVDIGALRRLSEPTGGRAYLLEDAHRDGQDLIARAIAEIGAALREQYSLGYYPPPADGKARLRRIEVKVSDRAHRVRARTGYWAGGPP